MEASLIQYLQEIKDFRTSQGKRYPLWLILLLVVMGTMSGCRSYYALEDFADFSRQVLKPLLAEGFSEGRKGRVE